MPVQEHFQSVVKKELTQDRVPRVASAHVLQTKMSATQSPVTGHFQVVDVKDLIQYTGEGVLLRRV